MRRRLDRNLEPGRHTRRGPVRGSRRVSAAAIAAAIAALYLWPTPAARAQAPVVIDDFQVPQNRVETTQLNTPLFAPASGDPSSIVGGERDIDVIQTVQSAPSDRVGAIVTLNNQNEGELSFSCDSGVTGELRLIWDGQDANPAQASFAGLDSNGLRTGGTGIDLTSGGRFDAVEILVVRADQQYNLGLAIHGGGVAQFTRQRPISNGATLLIPFSAFTGTADFTDVGAISLQASGDDLDLRLDLFRSSASVNIKMIDTVLDPTGTPRAPGEPARPGDIIRYTVAIENPDDPLAFPSDPLTFTYDPTAPPTNGVVTMIRDSFTYEDPTQGSPDDTNDDRVSVDINAIPDRPTPAAGTDCAATPDEPGCGTCFENRDDDGCVVFTFDVQIPSSPEDIPPGLPNSEIPGRGTITAPNGFLTNVPTDDASTEEGPDDNQTVVAYCGNNRLDPGEGCDDNGTADGDGCNAVCLIENCPDGVVCPGPGACVPGTPNCNTCNTDEAGAVGDASCASGTCINGLCGVVLPVLGGGGCSTASQGAGFGIGMGLILLILLSWRRSHRRSSSATGIGALVLLFAGSSALVSFGLEGEARAQEDNARNFSAERFKLSSDRDGILDVESGTVIGHLNWDLGFWIGYADDPLAVYMQENGERTDEFLSRRIGGEIVAAVGFGRRLQLGVNIPVVVNQAYDFMDAALAPASSTGVGDISLHPKLQLLFAADHGVNLAIIPALTLPSRGKDSYFGDVSVTFSPTLALSRRIGRIGLGGNLGYRLRSNTPETLQLTVVDELFARLGASYRVNSDPEKPLDVGLSLSLSLATAAADIIGDFNRNHIEGLAGGDYRVTDNWNVFAGAGLGLNPGFGTPDWRLVAGLRFARHSRPLICQPGYEAEGNRCLRICPTGTERRGDECVKACPEGSTLQGDECVVPVKCPDNPPNKDADCDGVETPPWLIVGDPDGPVPAPPGPGGEPVPSIHLPPGGVFPPGIEQHDYCPDVPGLAKYHGCPEPTVAVAACSGAPTASVSVSPSIGFLADSDTIDLPSRIPLEALAEQLVTSHPNALITIDVGGATENDDLAEKRASAIATFLLGKGVNGSNLSYASSKAPAGQVKFERSCPQPPLPPPVCQKAVPLEKRIRFEVNSDVIKPSSIEMLERDVLWVLMAHPGTKVRVEGHTSSEGKLNYNMSLSQRRAESVVNYLVEQGVAKETLTAVGYGPKHLAVKPERSEADREQNRRIEFQVTGGPHCPCNKFKVDKIYFEYNSGVIKPESFAELDRVAVELTKRLNVHLQIEGHTSSEGASNYNRRLSATRAASVRKYLIGKGVAQRRLTSKGFGEDKLLINPDNTEEERETNRRVEFTITRGADDCQ